MQKRLLLRTRESTTEKWIKENYPDDLIFCLDTNPHRIGIPTTIGIEKGLNTLYTSFVGTINPLHNPLLFLETAACLSRELTEDCVIQFPFWQNQYLYHQILKSILDLIQPTEIYIDHKIILPPNLSHLKFQKVVFDEGPTETFLRAKRRSFWSQFFDQAKVISVSLDDIFLEGSRIGAGQILNTIQFDHSVLYAELLGTTLFLVAQKPLASYQKKMFINQVGALKIIETYWWNYSGLVCNIQEKSLLNVNLSIIQKIDFLTRMIHLFVLEPFPDHLKHIQLGLLRLNDAGKEVEERNSLSL